MSRQCPDFEHKLSESIDVTGFCWLWTASVDVHGYGYVSMARRKIKAHRWVYENLVGPIEEGLVIDHLCRVRHCVNPDHLEPVTRAVNNARGYWAIKRYCPQGHDQTDPAHVYVRRNGKRMCRTCANEAYRRWIERKSA